MFAQNTNPSNIKEEPHSIEIQPEIFNPRTKLEIAPVKTIELTTSNTSPTEEAHKLALSTLLIELGHGNRDFVTKLQEGFDKAVELMIANPSTPIVGMKSLVLQADRAINVFKSLEAPKTRCIATSSRKRKLETIDEEPEKVQKKQKLSDDKEDKNCNIM